MLTISGFREGLTFCNTRVYLRSAASFLGLLSILCPAQMVDIIICVFPRQVPDNEGPEQAADPSLRHSRQHVRVGRFRGERRRAGRHAVRASIRLREPQEDLDPNATTQGRFPTSIQTATIVESR